MGRQDEQKHRARQNVILELGMVLSRLGRKRVAILYQESVERPSDIDGLMYIPFREFIEEAKALLFRELQNAGYNPRTDAL
jgi:predicted nucleotide-binding protein